MVPLEPAEELAALREAQRRLLGPDVVAVIEGEARKARKANR
jgi:hypothetical protein